MGDTKRRNGTIEVLRFISAIFIAFRHLMGRNEAALKGVQVMQNGTLAVEFFFIVSGFFLMRYVYRVKAEQDSCAEQTVGFMKKKIRGIMPDYFIGWLISFAVLHVYKNAHTLEALANDFVRGLPELFMVSYSGLSDRVFLTGSWYISSMLIAMFIIVPIALKKKAEFSKIIAPIAALMIYGILNRNGGDLRGTADLMFNLFFKGLIRAIAGISLGCAVYEISDRISKTELSKAARIGLGAAEVISLGFYILYAFSDTSKYDFAVVGCIFVGVSIALSKADIFSGILSNGVSDYLGKWSFSIFLAQGCLATGLSDFIPRIEGWAFVGVFVACLIVLSLAEMYLCKAIRKYILKWN